MPKPDSDPDDPWLTLTEIAEELRMSPATIRSWVSQGTLKATRPGRRKWLVRRSELDRILSAREAASPAPETDDGPWDRQDTIGPPHRSPQWLPDVVEHITRAGWAGFSETEWRNALRSSAFAPPDPYFIFRVRRIAEAAARKASALTDLDGEDPPEWWVLQPELDGGVLSYELQPAANRPGPRPLWDRVDRAVGALTAAMRERSLSDEIAALEQLSLALQDVAHALIDSPYPWLDDARRGDPEILEIPPLPDPERDAGAEPSE
jgi:excisionase family DNA binding protein